jgi:trk system potassium uptake protein TrkH
VLGGFSPYDASIEYYRLAGYPHSILIEYILIVGMTLGGVNFVIHFRVLPGRLRSLWDNAEMRAWWLLLAVFTAVIMLERAWRVESYAGLSPLAGPFWTRLESDFRTTLFQVVSVITTTGFGTKDLAAPYFGDLARILFLVMMVGGGCVGSTGGGIKVLRLVILNKLVWREVYRLRVPPQAVSRVILDGEAVSLNEIQRGCAIYFTWMAMLLLGGAVTEILSEYGGYQALSGMFSALGNVGPCYIPYDKMNQLHPVVKLVYVIGIMAGRLEILPVLLLFSRRTWR